MLEEENKELQQAAGGDTETDQKETQQPDTAIPDVNMPEAAAAQEGTDQPERSEPVDQEQAETPEAEQTEITDAKQAETSDNAEAAHSQPPAKKENKSEDPTPSSEAEEGDGEDEIDESNAEDAEDAENERRHHIPFMDYHALSMENLVGELQRLMRTEKVQAIRRHVDAIKYEFDQKFQDFIEHKKEEFVERGGNESDFRYNSVTKRQFNELYSEYREKRNQYYRNLEQNLKQNLANRQTIIEELKGLVNMEEDMNSTYQHFKELQERWRIAGPIPRTRYNDVWRTYQHHVEIFYDFLHLNRELRDLDFRHNLEEKERLIERAEALLEETDLNKAFRELQTLHKIWKEDVGPVAKEDREAIWQRFSAATKAMHQRRQEHLAGLEKRYEDNLEAKNKIIGQIGEIANSVGNNHRAIQQQIRQVEGLREQFFQAGKVPQKDNEATWASFKEAVRRFNRNKNAFYKNLKREQQENLDKKRALLERAQELQESEDWDTATPEMKRIQKEWKEVGHVPRKYSDKIWKQFKEACNHYFNRLHALRNKSQVQERENLDQKTLVLDQLKAFNLTGNRASDLKQVQRFMEEWKAAGRIPQNRKHLNTKFYKIVDALMRKLGVSKQEAEILKYGNKIQQLAKEDDAQAVQQERQFVRKKIEENKNQIRQLENNLEFFTDPTEDNPVVREVVANIDRQKKALADWKAKLKKLNIIRNNLDKEAEAANNEEE